jgi:two-component system nitrate/nitrite response regulator NarL
MRVAIIADIRLYRESLLEVLTKRGVEVVATADSEAPTDDLGDPRPELVLVDTAVADCTATLRRLAQRFPQADVVAIGVPETEHHVLACAEAGVAGYVPREGSLDDLVDTIRNVARGESLCSPTIAASLLRRVATLAAQQRPDTDPLTVRELQIVELIHQGLSNKQIAGQLCIELSTVKNHVHNILEKLQVRRRADAAARVMSAGARPYAWGSLHPHGRSYLVQDGRG